MVALPSPNASGLSDANAAAWPRLKQSSWLSNLPDSAANTILTACRPLHLAPGALLHAKGDPCKGLYGLEQGALQVGAVTHAGDELIVTRLSSGDWFGEIAVLDHGPRTHDAYAVDACLLAWLDMATIANLQRQHSEFQYWLALLLCRHVRDSFQAIDEFLILNARQRLAQRLIHLHQQQPGQPIKMSQQALAALVGLSRQSISRIIHDWQRRGWLKIQYGALHVVSPQALRGLFDNEK